MNEIQKLIAEFGSYRKLAIVMGITPPALTNMQNKGMKHVPPKYNDKIREGAKNFSAKKKLVIERLLDHSCPTCGRPY